MRRLILVLTGIAVALIIVIGGIAAALIAGGDGEEGGPPGTPTAGETPQAQPTLPPREEGELRLFGPDPITLDPALASDAASARYIVEVYSGLVSFDKDLNIIPDIAEKWDVSADGKVYTFHLRRGVLFHDGSRQVTAADFKYSMERALHPSTLSTVAMVYLNDIVGAAEYSRGDADEVTGIKVVDDFTLEITIDAPKPYFLAKLTYPTAYVVDRRQVEGNPRGWTRKPNGTGPFKLAEWRLGERIVLEPNERYYLDPKPSLARVTFLLAGGSPLTMYENDEVDITGVGVNDIERIRDPNEPLHAEFQETPSLDTFYIGFNTEEPPFDDVKVRQAFAMAIDKETLVRVVLLDLVVAAKGILPPDMPGYNPDLKGLPFDPQRAQELLEESKYGGARGLPPIVLTSSGRGATVGPVLEAVQAMWQDNLGVSVDVQQVEFATFLQDLDAGNFQMFDLGWIADYVDPQNFLDIKFHGDSLNNETKYDNPRVNQLLEQARTEQDAEKRIALYRQAEEIIVEEAPWIPLFHSKNNALIKPYVQGYQLPPLVIPSLKYVSISQQP